MALMSAASLLLNAAVESASLLWMELAMFSIAALVYALGAGRLPRALCAPAKNKAAPRRKTPTSSDSEAETSREAREREAVLDAWRAATCAGGTGAPPADLARVVDCMQKMGQTPLQVVSELRAALGAKPDLLPAMAALPAALLRDNAAELLDATLKLLEEHGAPADAAVYGGLMAAQLRRRDFAAVAATAARLPEGQVMTPKMRAALVASAAHRGELNEALGQLRELPTPEADAAGTARNCVLAGTAVAQLLAVAAKERRVLAAAQELQRVGARLEPKHLDELLASEARRRGGAAACRELVAGAEMLGVPKGPSSFLVLAAALAQAVDVAGLRALVGELEGGATVSVLLALGEPLTLGLLEACRLVRSADLVQRALSLHRTACAGTVRPRVAAAACSALLAADQGAEACDFYVAELELKGRLPDAVLTYELLRAAAKTGRTALAQRLSDRADGLSPTAGASKGGQSELQRHAMMIKAYGRDKDLAGATAAFERLRASGQTLSPMIYNCLLDACIQCGDLEAVAKHFEEMKRHNLVDVVGYNTLLKAHLAGGRTEEARALVLEMTERGLQANKVTYNELLHAKVLARDRHGAWAMVDEMRAAGVHANSVTCSILLKSLTPQSPPTDLRRVATLIEEVDEPVDEVLVSSAIDACIRLWQLELLSELLCRFRQRAGGLTLTVPTYGSMIKAFGQAGDVARVRELWVEMEERGVKPASVTLGCMVEALVVNGQAEEAHKLVLRQLESEELRGSVNTVIYSTVLKGFASSRQLEKVFAVYTEMRGHGIGCNTITYNTLLDACAKCSAMDRASALLEDMRESCVEPDVITYSTIIKGYCLAGDVDRAFKVLAELKADGKFAPDEIMYNSVLDGCAKQHRVEEALRLLEEMKASGVGPSNYTLSILVKLLGHARRLSQAFQMVEDLSKQNNFRPNVQVYTCLAQACVMNRRLERALALSDAMAEAGCQADDKFYAVLARGCLQLHQPLKALEVVRIAYGLGQGAQAQGRSSARGRAVGVEARALEELAGRIQAGGGAEREAFAQLAKELLEHRGVRLGEGRSAGNANQRRSNGRR